MCMYVISRFHNYGAVSDMFRPMLRLISGKMMLFELCLYEYHRHMDIVMLYLLHNIGLCNLATSEQYITIVKSTKCVVPSCVS